MKIVNTTIINWPSCSIFNVSTTQKYGVRCIENGGMYYDICKNECLQDFTKLNLGDGLPLETFVYGSVFPFLIFIVVIANFLIALVLSQRHMITPTNVVLRYMAIADLCVGLVSFPWTFFYYTLRFSDQPEKVDLWWCYMYKYTMDGLPPIFHNSAMWLTVLLAGQRYISIEYPIKSRLICSVKNVRLCSIVIVIVTIICGLPKFFDSHISLYDGWVYHNDGYISHIRTCRSEFTILVNELGPNTYFNLYFWTRIIFFILIPSILLTFLNFSLIRGIRKAEKRKEKLLREKRAREAEKQRDSNSTSMMLVIIASIFLIVNLPQAIFISIVCFCNTFDIDLQLMSNDTGIIFKLFNNMMVMATYPINFGIYCFMSSAFRKSFKALLCSKNWKSSLLSTGSTKTRLFSTINSNHTESTLGKLISPSVIVENYEEEMKPTEILLKLKNDSLIDENRCMDTIYL
ncbi:G-protein coupled receptor [Strongyloides ratti]|uniref:G-protein coupled receptor n=1 Tax=Strongyloides ratti TaxID=34506 RepID=A0A090KYT1_STRRB|nr:G-protein coupled receptor [Strongyloides ratti]CEF60389.1 G-protein coupled receptor [Strongyloides ratti]